LHRVHPAFIAVTMSLQKRRTMKQWKFELLMKPPAKPLTEGPVWDGEHLYFTHIQASRIMRYDPKSGEITVAREGTNRTNGLCYDAKGNLFGCSSGGRSIVRFDPDGKNTVITDNLAARSSTRRTISRSTARAASGSPIRSTAATGTKARKWRSRTCPYCAAIRSPTARTRPRA
jgi:streptogramin lyase